MSRTVFNEATGLGFQDAKAALEKLETTLVSAFRRWARTNDVRIHELTRSFDRLDERLQLIEERVSELEREA